MKTIQIAGMLMLATFSALAIAGYTQPAPVTVTVNADGSGTANGDMVTARYSDNEIENIGCGVRAIDDGAGGVWNYGFCQVRDASGVQGFCATERSDLLDVMKATSDFSFIIFSWNAAGECTYIGFSTQSFYLPEQPAGNPGRGGRP